MTAQNTSNSSYLTRQSVYSSEVIPPLEPMLLNDNVVLDVSDQFSDGETFFLSKMGMPSIRQRTESEDTRVDNIPGTRVEMDITEFPESAVGITRKNAEDAYLMGQFLQYLVPLQRNALMQRYETTIMALQGEQTLADSNLFNGVPHRLVGTGTNNIITTDDFDAMAYALDTANVSAKNRVAIISPAMARNIKKEIGQVNIAFNRDFLGLPAEAIRNGLDVSIEIGGFRVFVSNFAAEIANETISGDTVTNGSAAMFFSLDGYDKPLARGWRRMPSADVYIDHSKDNMEVYRVNARWGAMLYRPEALGVVIANNS